LLVDRSLFETMFAAVWGFQHARVVATGTAMSFGPYVTCNHPPWMVNRRRCF
jgi:hypothetical protein